MDLLEWAAAHLTVIAAQGSHLVQVGGSFQPVASQQLSCY